MAKTRLSLVGFGARRRAVAGASNTIAVPVATLSLSALAPTIAATANQTIAAPVVALALSAQAPSLAATGNQIVNAPVIALALAALVPTIAATANNVIAAPSVTFSLAPQAPIVLNGQSQIIAAPTVSISLAVLAPSLVTTANNSIQVPLAHIAMAVFAPTVTGSSTGNVHMRTVIRNAFIAALSGLPTTGSRVFGSRVYPLQERIDLPGILVMMGEEPVDTETMWPPRVQIRQPSLTVTLCLRSNASLDDDIDSMLMEVEPALAMPAINIPGVKGVTLTRIMAPKFSAEGDRPLASVALFYDVNYATPEGAPGTPV